MSDHQTTERAPEERLLLPGPAGKLEANLRRVPPGIEPVRAALLCHPHPLHGGSMQNKVIYRIALGLAETAQTMALRFNFRGAGESEGEHDEGRGELGDVHAALDWLAANAPGLPLCLVGYSFGAAVGLRAGVMDRRVRSMVGLGLPLGLGIDLDYLERCTRPLLLVQGDEDEFGDGAAMTLFVDRLSGPVQLELIGGSDHLFTGKEDAAVDATVSWIRESPAAPSDGLHGP